MELGEVLIVVFTGVVAVSTGAYAFLTWKLVSETRRLREVQTEPKISVRLELAEHVESGGLELVFRNEGHGPAKNIRFRFQGDPTHFIGHGQQQPMDQVPVIKNGLAYLGPGQRFGFLLGWLFGKAFARASREPWTFHIDYENLSGKSKKDTYLLDFSQFEGLIVGGGPPLVRIEKHLDSLRKDVHHLLTGFNRPRIITQTVDDYRKELEQHIEQRRGTAPVDQTSDTENQD